MKALGHTRWAIAAGHAPSRSTGEEPRFTSRDQLALLNTGDTLADVRLTVIYATRESPGVYRLGVAPRRLRVVRVNDLIFPEAVRLDEPYSLAIESDVPVVVQFTRQDTRAAWNAATMAMAWSDD